MKNLFFLLFCFAILSFALPAAGQIVSKGQSEASGNAGSTQESQLPVDFSTSRQEDISLFEKNMKIFQNAIDTKNSQEAKMFLNRNIEITKREIARAKNNLDELKAGKTRHLEEWRKANGANGPVNISQEINRLNDNINSMEYRYKNLKTADVNNITDPMAARAWLGDMRVILKNMNSNLAYESDKKVTHGEKPPANETQGQKGAGAITQNQAGTSSGTGNTQLDDFYTTQAARKAQFKEEKNNYQSQLQSNDYKSARRTYKTLLQIMQTEIDANSWLKTQKDEESIKMATINLDTVSPVIAEQQKILDEASKIKVPMEPGSGFNPTESLELISKFEQTLN